MSKILESIIKSGKLGETKPHPQKRAIKQGRWMTFEYSEREREFNFWSMIKVAPSGCWEWTAGKNPQGYGKISITLFGKREQQAQRVAWIYKNGPIPNGRMICHHCDNPACINPDHLFVGTHKENSDDKVKKGRQWKPIGTLNPHTKINEDVVRTIRTLRGHGIAYKEVARISGSSENVVNHILNGRCWSHVK